MEDFLHKYFKRFKKYIKNTQTLKNKLVKNSYRASWLIKYTKIQTAPAPQIKETNAQFHQHYTTILYLCIMLLNNKLKNGVK